MTGTLGQHTACGRKAGKQSGSVPKIRIPLARPDITCLERELVQQALVSGQLSRGGFLRRFESAAAKVLEIPHAVATASGTAGLILALQALGVRAGDEVITASYTVPATINAIVAVGARPVLVDIDERTRGLSPAAVRNAINERTAAVIVVHAFGQAAQLSALSKVCEEAAVPLIEDACEAFGNRLHGQALGSFGACGVFGFYPNKQLTTGEGGVLVTRHAQVAESARRLLNNGRDMDGSWLDQQDFGWNFRLDEMSAALGLAQLQRLDSLLARRRQVADWYDTAMQTHLRHWRRGAFSGEESGNAWFAYVVHRPVRDNRLSAPDWFSRADARTQAFCQKLAAAGIQSGRYFAPLHKQPAFQARWGEVCLPVTEKLAVTGLALPFYTQLTPQEVESVVLTLRQAEECLCD